METAVELITGMGDVALSYYGKGRHGLKFDESLVTEAELQLRERLNRKLTSVYPRHRLFDNGTDYESVYTHDEKRYLWVFDALDGVANFQGGIPIWGMSIALLENNWPVLGVFHMPATGDIFNAMAEGQAMWKGSELPRVTGASIDDESVLLVNSRFHMRYSASFPGKIRNFGCSGAHMCYVATGKAEGAVIFNESYQGLAAASVIGKACGVGLYRMDGSEFSYSGYTEAGRMDESLLVAPRDIAGEILDYIAVSP